MKKVGHNRDCAQCELFMPRRIQIRQILKNASPQVAVTIEKHNMIHCYCERGIQCVQNNIFKLMPVNY